MIASSAWGLIAVVIVFGTLIAPLTPEQRDALKLCRAALHDALYGPESKLGLKPPRQVDEPEHAQTPR